MGGDFHHTVVRIVRAIPAGEVMSYGEVAIRAGRPGAARAVVAVLHHAEKIPWWRVVRTDRTLAEPVAREQARRLRAEGVRVVKRRVGGGDARASGPDPAARRPLRAGPGTGSRARARSG